MQPSVPLPRPTSRQVRGEFFGQRDLTEDEADHAGAAGAGGAVGGQGDAAGFGVVNDGFAGVHGALTQQVGASRSESRVRWLGRGRLSIGGEGGRTCGHGRRLIEPFLGSIVPFAC